MRAHLVIHGRLVSTNESFRVQQSVLELEPNDRWSSKVNSVERNKNTRLKGLLAGLLAGSCLFAMTPAQAAGEDTDPVFIFNRICYAQVPKLDGIRDMARRLAWRSIAGDDLKKFTTIENPDVLEGWDAQVGERVFRVAIVRSTLNQKMKQTFPELGDGRATSCMLILDEQNDAATFEANMQTLAGKAAVSKDVPEGDLLTTTWAGGNNDLKVFLFAKANKNGRGGLLNVTILTKAGLASQ